MANFYNHPMHSYGFPHCFNLRRLSIRGAKILPGHLEIPFLCDFFVGWVEQRFGQRLQPRSLFPYHQLEYLDIRDATFVHEFDRTIPMAVIRQIRNFNPGITILHDNHMSKYDGVIEEGGELYKILFDCVNWYYPEFTQPVVI